MAKRGQEELRRSPRVRVCCRVEVRQPYRVWTAVTEDLSARGCGIVTAETPRLGSRLAVRLSSDLFTEELSATGEVVWASGERIGVLFLDEARAPGATAPNAWLRHVLEHGCDGGSRAVPPPGEQISVEEHVVPSVSSAREPEPISLRPRRRSG